MIPGDYDITIYKGGTFTIELTANDGVSLINFNDLYDSALMYVQHAWLGSDEPTPTEPLLTLSTANDRIVFNNTICKLHIPASITKTLTFSSGVYSLKLIKSGTETVEDIILQGEVIVKGGPTP